MKHCEECGKEYDGRGKCFCSVECRQRNRNKPGNNPARTKDARAKISKAMSGNTNCLGREMSNDTRQKIADALMGRSQAPDHVANRVAGWKAAMEDRGGISERHRQQLDRIRPAGTDHWAWNGGTTEQRSAEFSTPEYQSFVQSVLERDNYTCQSCGARNGGGVAIRLEVHHIKSYAAHPELRFDTGNGITLCLDCHNDTKRGKPRPRRKDFVPMTRTCQICGVEFAIRNGRKYCPECRSKYCCPVCGSTVCHHSARTRLPHALPTRT